MLATDHRRPAPAVERPSARGAGEGRGEARLAGARESHCVPQDARRRYLDARRGQWRSIHGFRMDNLIIWFYLVLFPHVEPLETTRRNQMNKPSSILSERWAKTGNH